MADWYSMNGEKGGGGAGGGEPVNNTFIEPSSGGDGYAYMVILKTYPADISEKLRVNVNGNNYKVVNAGMTYNYSYNKCEIIASHSTYDSIRSYQTSPLKVDEKYKLNNVEYVDDKGLNENIGLVSSKITNDDSPLKLLYLKDENSSNIFNYNIETKKFLVDTTSSKPISFVSTYSIELSDDKNAYIGSLDAIEYVYVLLQAGGGGGGGADNTWGLFNYASGGGGGGGGGAVCFRILIDHAIYKHEITIGKGGSRGENKNYGTVGSSGGYSSFVLKDLNNNILAEVKVSGGTGGGGGAGQSVGSSGAGGTLFTYTDNAGILTKIAVVDGGAGGKGGVAGSEVSSSGVWTDAVNTGLCNVTFTAEQSFGTPGPLVGADDKGGSGGASWLGNGGFYTDELFVSAM